MNKCFVGVCNVVAIRESCQTFLEEQQLVSTLHRIALHNITSHCMGMRMICKPMIPSWYRFDFDLFFESFLHAFILRIGEEKQRKSTRKPCSLLLTNGNTGTLEDMKRTNVLFALHYHTIASIHCKCMRASVASCCVFSVRHH